MAHQIKLANQASGPEFSSQNYNIERDREINKCKNE